MAARGNAETTESQGRVLMIERVFDAPRELVFRCWTEPAHLERWMGPRGFTIRLLACDLRPGGNLRVHMRAPDGRDHWQNGIFREIVPPERLVRTFCWTDEEGAPRSPETVLTVTFADLGGKTRLTLHQAIFESVNARNEHQEGWSSSFDVLTEYLAAVRAG